MSRTRKPKSPTNGRTNHDDPNRKLFVTSRGVTVTLRPYSTLAANAQNEALKDEWLEDGKPLPHKPTYELKTVTGAVETHEHDETTVKGDPEALAAWRTWQAESAAFDREAAERTLRNFILDCMEFEVDPRWAAKARATRTRVPADEYAAKIYWAMTEVFGADAEIVTAMTYAAELAGVPSAELEAVRDSFRREVAEPGRPAG